ncbi:MAG TPA: hypothetical protein VHZ78_08120 [Rhizomicrobium sp.]|jgi:hypothetical protein|nr:hypothetical protein [Rhizomicrobium sp.]
MKRTIAALVFIAAATTFVSDEAEARGCIKGAVVGAIAGHYAHHHAVLGAIGGCIVGRHLANQHDREARAAHDHAAHH